MLFTENQTMTIDSAKTLQGSILPVLDFKTEKENVLTFKNTANINLLIKKDRVINVINKFELSTHQYRPLFNVCCCGFIFRI